MEIFIILLLILLNGLFAMSEIALISARKSNLTAQAKQGNKRARQALKLAEDPNKFLSTVQIGITLIGILTGIYSGAAIADDLREVFVRWGVPYAAPVAQTLIVIVVTYLTIVFGELIPKRIGMTAAEPVAKLVAGPMKVLSVVASPFVWLLSKSIEGISRLFGLRDTDSPVTGREPHGRYPVGEGSLDRLVGVVYLKDLFSHIGDPGFSLRQILSPVKLFHEGAEVYMALEQLRTEQLGYGIVCDEFGVTQGIVTLKDIFEALVGELLEDREEPDIVVREDGSVLVDGQCSFYDFLAHFGLEDVYSSAEYNTISGLILDELEHIPHSGEYLQWECFRLEVVDMDGARIDKVLATMIDTSDNKNK